jgi:hypothetical protein
VCSSDLAADVVAAAQQRAVAAAAAREEAMARAKAASGAVATVRAAPDAAVADKDKLAALAREQAALKRRDDEARKDAEQAELAAEIARLEEHLVERGKLPAVSINTELLRLRELAGPVDYLPNRVARSIAYAERARNTVAVQLAQREIERLQEEEELAVLMALALD